MTVSLFITLLALFSGATGLVVEAEKKIIEELHKKVAPNCLALLTACVIGWIGTTYAYIFTGAEVSLQNVLALLLMGFASGLCSMVGYDKVVQLIGQLKG